MFHGSGGSDREGGENVIEPSAAPNESIVDSDGTFEREDGREDEYTPSPLDALFRTDSS